MATRAANRGLLHLSLSLHPICICNVQAPFCRLPLAQCPAGSLAGICKTAIHAATPTPPVPGSRKEGRLQVRHLISRPLKSAEKGRDECCALVNGCQPNHWLRCLGPCLVLRARI